MDENDAYVLADAELERERSRLRSLEAWCDGTTFQHLEAVGVTDGWRCVEVGAGGGSVARWLGERVAATGSVLAIDLDVRYLSDLPPTVEVRRHDITTDELASAAYDLVHCRAVLQHLRDPRVALARMADAVAPGGWLVVEENDLGLFHLAGSADAAKAAAVIHDLVARCAAAGVLDANFGRKVPGLVQDFGLEAFGVDAVTGVARHGEPVFEALRLGWPEMRRAAAALGIGEAELSSVDEVFEAASTLMVAMTLFAAWGRKPR